MINSILAKPTPSLGIAVKPSASSGLPTFIMILVRVRGKLSNGNS